MPHELKGVGRRMYNIAVIGLGYVGLPVAVGAAKHFESVIGFDIKKKRIEELRSGHDSTGEVNGDELKTNRLLFTSEKNDLKNSNFFIVTVPTPIDQNLQPDLSPLRSACECIGPVLSKGSIVVFESTVYPGVTEEFCGPLLAKISGLIQGVDFKLGYSPERINPGDKERRLETIQKIIAAEDTETLKALEDVYGKIVKAGLHKASSIKVAEAAKVIENTQRDLNIALMNELSLIFDRLNIPTKDVLEAAGTKWNFLPFTPGLVGGHCIGVDPYYLTAKAESVGYHPQVILAGRRINDGMGKFIAEKTVKLMMQKGVNLQTARVGILGLTFKENVPDLRNSRVPDIIKELSDFGIHHLLIHDPQVNAEEAHEEYGVELCEQKDLINLDCLILAVSHREFKELGIKGLQVFLNSKAAVFIDVKSFFYQNRSDFAGHVSYWSL